MGSSAVPCGGRSSHTRSHHGTNTEGLDTDSEQASNPSTRSSSSAPSNHDVSRLFDVNVVAHQHVDVEAGASREGSVVSIRRAIIDLLYSFGLFSKSATRMTFSDAIRSSIKKRESIQDKTGLTAQLKLNLTQYKTYFTSKAGIKDLVRVMVLLESIQPGFTNTLIGTHRLFTKDEFETLCKQHPKRVDSVIRELFGDKISSDDAKFTEMLAPYSIIIE
jgi:hypothetical protein